jgi:hypothetical protein
LALPCRTSPSSRCRIPPCSGRSLLGSIKETWITSDSGAGRWAATLRETGGDFKSLKHPFSRSPYDLHSLEFQLRARSSGAGRRLGGARVEEGSNGNRRENQGNSW